MEEPKDVEKVFDFIMKLRRKHANNPRQMSIPLTSFHVALAEGDVGSVTEVLHAIGDKNVKVTFLNASVIPCCSSHVTVGVTRRHRQLTLAGRNKVSTSEGRAPLPARSRHTVYIRLPTNCLEFAAYSGKAHLVLLLLDHGARSSLTDVNGHNVLHYIVCLAEGDPDRAVRIYRELVLCLDVKTLSSLLEQENKEGMVPLDLAAELPVPEMISAILNTERVYKHVDKDCGTHRHVRYDVTRYEANDTDAIHLMYYLTCATEQDVVRIERNRLFKTEPMATWIRAKYRQYSRLVFVCFLIWITLLSTYVGTVAFVVKQMSLPSRAWSASLIGIHLAVLVMTSVDLTNQRRSLVVFWGRIFRRRIPVCACGVYRFYQFCFCCSVVVTSGLHFVPDLDFTSPLYLGLSVTSLMLGVFSMLLFFQLDETMGHMLTAIEKMFTVAMEFLSVTCFIYLALAFSFYIYHLAPDGCPPDLEPQNDTTAASSTAPQPDCSGVPKDAMFWTFARSLYESILISLGVMVPKSIYFTEASFPPLAIALYVISLMIVFIVMMNMMLAFINKRLLEIDEHKESIITIQKLAVTLFVSTHRILIPIIRLVSFSGRCATGKDIFVRTKNPDKVYVRVVEK